MKLLTCALLLLAATSAARAADVKYVLRMATAAPDGTGYARELKAFAREIGDATDGEVQVKWYWGGIAGDDAEVAARVRRGQLDGFASGVICQLIAPSFRALHVPGLFRSRDEVRYVAGQLQSDVNNEFRQAGYEFLGIALLGPVEIFSRHPVRTMADLKRDKLWVWEADAMLRLPLGEMGVPLVALPIEAAGRGYSDGKHDGFLSIPSGALAFQWYTQAHYLTELRVNFLTGCMAVTNRAFDPLPGPYQQALKAAAAKMSARLEHVNAEQDGMLLGGLFTKQGVTPVAITDAFREELAEAARAAVERLGDKLIQPALLKRVSAMIEELRAAHATDRRP